MSSPSLGASGFVGLMVIFQLELLSGPAHVEVTQVLAAGRVGCPPVLCSCVSWPQPLCPHFRCTKYLVILLYKYHSLVCLVFLFPWQVALRQLWAVSPPFCFAVTEHSDGPWVIFLLLPFQCFDEVARYEVRAV